MHETQGRVRCILVSHEWKKRFAAAEVLLYASFPVAWDGGAGAHAGDSLAQDVVIQPRTGGIAVVAHRALPVNADAARTGRRVHIRAEEQKLPAIFLLARDHCADLIRSKAAACVLHAVCGDDKQRVLGHILRAGRFVHAADVVDGAAHRVVERCTAAHGILCLRQFGDIAQADAVVDHFAAVVKEHGGHEGLPLRAALLLQHGIEAADGIALQAVHGAAAVKYKCQLRSSLFHVKTSCTVPAYCLAFLHTVWEVWARFGSLMRRQTVP